MSGINIVMPQKCRDQEQFRLKRIELTLTKLTADAKVFTQNEVICSSL